MVYFLGFVKSEAFLQVIVSPSVKFLELLIVCVFFSSSSLSSRVVQAKEETRKESSSISRAPLTFLAKSLTTLLALWRSDTLELITSCLKCLMYSVDEWSLMPSMKDILRYPLSRPRMRSQMLVIPSAPLRKTYSKARNGNKRLLVRRILTDLWCYGTGGVEAAAVW